MGVFVVPASAPTSNELVLVPLVEGEQRLGTPPAVPIQSRSLHRLGLVALHLLLAHKFGHLRGSRRLSHLDRVPERTKHRRGFNTQWCEIFTRSTPLTSDQATEGEEPSRLLAPHSTSRLAHAHRPACSGPTRPAAKAPPLERARR